MSPAPAASQALAATSKETSAPSSQPGSPRIRRLSRPSNAPSRIDLPSAGSFAGGFTNGNAPTTGGRSVMGEGATTGPGTSAPPSSFFGSRPPSPSYYREALADIHASLYAGAFGMPGDSTPEARSALKSCVERWYETDAVFENPLTRSTGRVAIANQFCWLASIPGQRWSEVGDVCECQDFNGNHVLVISHTLHSSFFPTNYADDLSHRPPIPTPFQSVPPTPFAYTPAPGTPGTSIVSEHHFHHHRRGPRNLISGEDYEDEEDGESDHVDDEGVEADDEDGPAEDDDEEDYDQALSSPRPYQRNASRSRGAGKGGSPLALFISFLHPRRVLARLGHYHLRVITRLEFNEQGRVAYHEDFWGVKELVEGTIPLLGQLYYFQRQAAGTIASWLARTMWPGSAATPTNMTASVNDGRVYTRSRRYSSAAHTPANSMGLSMGGQPLRTPIGGALKYGEGDDAVDGESEGYTDEEGVTPGGGTALAQAARNLSRQQRRFLAQQQHAREQQQALQRQQSQRSIRTQRSWGSSMGLWRSASAQQHAAQPHPIDVENEDPTSALGLSALAGAAGGGAGTPPLEGAINITSATEDRRLRRRAVNNNGTNGVAAANSVKGKAKAKDQDGSEGEDGGRDGDSSGREKQTSVAEGAYDD